MQEISTVKSSHIDLKAELFILLEKFAIERREVTLASGLKSNFYIDCRQVYFRGQAQFIIGELFYKNMVALEESGKHFDACGGMAMGSIPLTCALTQAWFRRGREFPGFAVRKETKDHGMMTSIEGNKCLSPNARALIVEDVVTTGSSSIKAIAALRDQGVIVDTLFAIVDRAQGGRENLFEIGVDLHSIFTANDLMGVLPCGSQ